MLCLRHDAVTDQMVDGLCTLHSATAVGAMTQGELVALVRCNGGGAMVSLEVERVHGPGNPVASSLFHRPGSVTD